MWYPHRAPHWLRASWGEHGLPVTTAVEPEGAASAGCQRVPCWWQVLSLGTRIEGCRTPSFVFCRLTKTSRFTSTFLQTLISPSLPFTYVIKSVSISATLSLKIVVYYPVSVSWTSVTYICSTFLFHYPFFSNTLSYLPYLCALDFIVNRGFPDSSVGKESACNAGDPGLIPELGRSLEKGKATHSGILG